MTWKTNLITGLSAASVLLLAGAAHAQTATGHAGTQVQQPAQPQRGALSFKTENLDLGVVHDGGKLDVEFPFTNKSEMPIMIIKVKPSCGCTVADDYEDVVIQPGETSILRLQFNPTGKVGRSSVTIRVETDDPDRPTFNLMMSADVEPIVQAEPNIIQFGDLRKGESKEITARVTGEMDDFKVLFATASDSEFIDIEVVEHARLDVKAHAKHVGHDESEALRSRDGTVLRVTFKGREKIGAFSESLLGRTNDERRKLIPINVLGRVVGDVHVVPDRIGLGLLKPGGEFEKTLHVSSRSGASFKIVEAYTDLDIDDSFNVEITELPTEDGSSSYQIRVHGAPATTHTQRRPVRGSLILKTDVPGEETLELKMYGSIRPTGTVTPQSPPK